MRIKENIPNIITLGNLFCGLVASLLAVDGALVGAAFFVALGALFDFLDGLIARIFGVDSAFGKQLDSLCDMVTFGVVPGIIMFRLLEMSEGSGSPLFISDIIETAFLLPFLGFLIPLASAWRLANFNIDKRQSSSFIGLPVPANTLLIASLPLIMEFDTAVVFQHLIENSYFLTGLTLLSCYLLNAEIPLFALKFKNLRWKDNAVRYIFLISAVLVLFLFHFAGIPILILLYILMSVIVTKIHAKKTY